MSAFQYFELPPPRSWEQFEELCADLFEAAWNDPALVRHGRAGQRQSGVDIVGRQGSRYPVGLQCKKKARWPVQQLTIREIDQEINEAKAFTPALQTFYLLTTAIDDERLQQHIRSINERHKESGHFDVVLLGWSEIARRVTRHEQVVRKHFTGFGAVDLVSPLLATWYTTAGKLELSPEDWKLSVAEVAEDFFDWPHGHIVLRQREVDHLIGELQSLVGKKQTQALRRRRIALRQEIRRLTSRERRIQSLLKLIFTNETLRTYFLEIRDDGNELPIVADSVIENALRTASGRLSDYKIRLLPPSQNFASRHWPSDGIAFQDIPVNIPFDIFNEIEDIKRRRRDQFGETLTDSVFELPYRARGAYALPAVLARIQRICEEEKRTWEEIEQAGYLDFLAWKVKC